MSVLIQPIISLILWDGCNSCLQINIRWLVKGMFSMCNNYMAQISGWIGTHTSVHLYVCVHYYRSLSVGALVSTLTHAFTTTVGKDLLCANGMCLKMIQLSMIQQIVIQLKPYNQDTSLIRTHTISDIPYKLCYICT